MEIPRLTRLYKVWRGNNKFFCGGRMVFGPDVSSLFLTTLLIAGPSLIFCAQVMYKIHKRETTAGIDQENHILGYPALIVALVVTAADMCFLLITSSRDPGIVPRNPRPPDDAFDSTTTPSMEWVRGASSSIRLPRTKDVNVNGFIVRVKFCDTCLLYRPPRASHCSICNNCVQKFDHHCPWVGQCIGLRNYRFFCLFISSSTFLCLYVFIFSWLNIIEEKHEYQNSVMKSMKGEVVSLLLIIYTFLSVWFVGGLTAFHIYLISTNQTTYENFRYRYDKKENPYNKGVLGNFSEVFFSAIPKSLNDFRIWVLDHGLEGGSVSHHDLLDMVSSREGADLEKGGSMHMSDLGSAKQIPKMWQNLDLPAADDNFPRKAKATDHDDAAAAAYAFGFDEPPIGGQGQGSLYAGQNYRTGGVDGGRIDREPPLQRDGRRPKHDEGQLPRG